MLASLPLGTNKPACYKNLFLFQDVFDDICGQYCQMKMFEKQRPMKMDYCINFPSDANDIHKYELPKRDNAEQNAHQKTTKIC